MIIDRQQVDAAELERRTGWAIKAQGACKGEICVPLPGSPVTTVDAGMLSERLGMALVPEPRHGLWALGPETLGGHALTTADAPELVLPDLEGRPLALSSLRGSKVMLLAWASY